MNKPDYRTKAARESEVLAQIEIEGGISHEWAGDNRLRASAVQRLHKAGKIKPLLGSRFGFQRYEIVEPARKWGGLFRSLAERVGF